jgi:FkbM family methyltransferase
MEVSPENKAHFDYLSEVYRDETWEPDTRLAFRRFIDKEHSYVDIGAWIGTTLMIGAPLAKKAYGFEPDPISFGLLKYNMEHSLPLTANVEIFQIAITPVTEKVSFGSRTGGNDSMSSLLFPDAATSWVVDGWNFTDWLDQHGITDCNFIKMDIEGGEYSVLPTMRKYLETHRPSLHLSLHPCFVGDQQAKGIAARVKRSIYRGKQTLKLLKVIADYNYIYDSRGRIKSSGIDTFSSHLRDWLAKISWKPAVLLLTVLYSLLGGNDAIIASQQRW